MLVHFISSSTSLKEMAPTKPIVKAKQDMPPKGGFPKVFPLLDTRRTDSNLSLFNHVYLICCHL